jgi:flagellar basal-body rod modification protein FlgD
MNTTAVATNPYAALSTADSSGKTANEAGSSDRFLKLLVTQMQNQDPLNPMDNAQITSQMAQISTVDGISKLNGTVEGLTSQFSQLQTLMGASLVGRDVTLQGNQLAVEGGHGVGGFELSGKADSVKVEILSPAGRVVDTLDLKAQPLGRHSFDWPAGSLPDGAPYSFRVVAKSGTAEVSSTSLMRDRVTAVTSNGTSLTLELQNSGSVAYRDVKAFN